MEPEQSTSRFELFSNSLFELSVLYIKSSQMMGRDPKVGRGTPIFNIRLYESSKI